MACDGSAFTDLEGVGVFTQFWGLGQKAQSGHLRQTSPLMLLSLKAGCCAAAPPTAASCCAAASGGTAQPPHLPSSGSQLAASSMPCSPQNADPADRAAAPPPPTPTQASWHLLPTTCRPQCGLSIPKRVAPIASLQSERQVKLQAGVRRSLPTQVNVNCDSSVQRGCGRSGN